MPNGAGEKPPLRRQAGAPLFYKERLGTKSPPHPPQCAHWGTFPPKGKALGVGAPLSDYNPHLPQPAQLGGGPLRALVHGPQARQKKKENPRRVPPN